MQEAYYRREEQPDQQHYDHMLHSRCEIPKGWAITPFPAMLSLIIKGTFPSRRSLLDRSTTIKERIMPPNHERARSKAIGAVVNRYNCKINNMAIDGPIFRIGINEFPINEITAEVVARAATSKQRITLTRITAGSMVAGPGGMLLAGAWKKSTDTTKIYISVVGPDGNVHTTTVPSAQESTARQFASNLESAAARTWPLQTPFGEIQLDPSARHKNVRDDAWVWYPAALLALVCLALCFVNGWFFLGVLAAPVLWLVLYIVHESKDEKALDAIDPEWRARQTAIEDDKNKAIWRAAQAKAAQSPENASQQQENPPTPRYTETPPPAPQSPVGLLPPPAVPAGWYADPHGGPILRYWDGTNWTQHTSPTPPN